MYMVYSNFGALHKMFRMYKLIGTRSTAGRNHVYIVNVGTGVLKEVMRILREMSMKRQGEYWYKYFDFVSKQEYFPRGPSVLLVNVVEWEDWPEVRAFCFSKRLPEGYEKAFEPDGEVEVALLFGRYTAVADIGGRIFVGGKVGSDNGAVCFKYSTSALEFLFDYSYCRDRGWTGCGGLTQDEVEDIMDLLTSKL